MINAVDEMHSSLPRQFFWAMFGHDRVPRQLRGASILPTLRDSTAQAFSVECRILP
jgi:hypothetical protein